MRRRLEAIVVMQQQGTAGITVKRLAHELDVSSATAYRIIEDLRDAGLGVESLPNHRKRLARAREPLAVTLDNGAREALDILRRSHPGLEGTFILAVLDALIEGRRSHIDSHASATERKVLRAIEQARPLSFSYSDVLDARPKPWMVEPAALKLVGGRLYLLAWSPRLKCFKRFALHRLQGVHISERGRVSRRPRPDSCSRGSHVSCTIRIARADAHLIECYPLHHDQEVALDGEDYVQVRARVPLTAAVRWALSWGRSAVPVAPRQLREQVLAKMA